MTPLPPVPNVLRVQWKCSLGADLDVLSRLYFAWSGTAPTNATCATVAGDIATYWGDNLKPYHTTSSTLTEVVVTDLTSSTAGTGSYAADTAGTRSGDPLSAGACACVNFLISRRYRGAKPKIFLPVGVAADLETVQTWTTAFTGDLLSAVEAFIANIQTISVSGLDIGTQQNVSYFEGFTAVMNPTTGRYRNVPVKRDTPLTDNVTGVAINPKIASQRRRNTQKR
jgi:hypothetical protein